MKSRVAFTLWSTLPARALLGRLLAVRLSLIVGCAIGIAWLHWAAHIPMPLWPMGAVLALMTLFSLTTAWRLRQDAPATQFEFLAHLMADLTSLAVLIFFSGGATNPFVSLMLVPVIIAAISLHPRWVWLLAAMAVGFYALLLFQFRPLAVADPAIAKHMHLSGMWFNFLVSAGLIAFFVTRMHAALRERDRTLSDLREKQLRDERIVALGTQAALAAHELATPLATLQTTAHELALEFANDPEIGADCRLLEQQARACKRILSQLALRAQDAAPEPQPLDDWLRSLLDRWQILRPEARLTLHLPQDARPFCPPNGFEHAILNVLNNAADASVGDIDITAHSDDGTLVIEVSDRGPGFTPEQKALAGRVVFSDKPEPGWGLGLALSHAALEHAGGTLCLTENKRGGASVRIALPWIPPT